MINPMGALRCTRNFRIAQHRRGLGHTDIPVVCSFSMSKLRLICLALAIPALLLGSGPSTFVAGEEVPTQIPTNCYTVPNNRVKDCGFELSAPQTAPFPTSPWKGKNMAVPLCPLEINTHSNCGTFSGGFAPFEGSQAMYHGFDGGGPVRLSLSLSFHPTLHEKKIHENMYLTHANVFLVACVMPYMHTSLRVRVLGSLSCKKKKKKTQTGQGCMKNHVFEGIVCASLACSSVPVVRVTGRSRRFSS
jgi:hypothetical protein